MIWAFFFSNMFSMRDAFCQNRCPHSYRTLDECISFETVASGAPHHVSVVCAAAIFEIVIYEILFEVSPSPSPYFDIHCCPIAHDSAAFAFKKASRSNFGSSGSEITAIWSATCSISFHLAIRSNIPHPSNQETFGRPKSIDLLCVASGGP